MDNKYVGSYGEMAMCKYLADRNYLVLDKNFRKKWGELDIVAKNGDIIHFIEVKTVSYETSQALVENYYQLIHRPEDRVGEAKKRKLKQLIYVWLAENECDTSYQFDIAAVYIVPREKTAAIDWFSNLEL